MNKIVSWVAGLPVPLVAPLIGALIVAWCVVAGRMIARSSSPTAARTRAVLQLARWVAIVGSIAAAVASLMLNAGIPGNVLIIFAGSVSTGFAFALRDPLSDFLAAASLLIERAAKLGDEVQINETLVGQLMSFGLRGVTIETWSGDQVYVVASTIQTMRNLSTGASRATVDIDIPADVRVSRAAAVLEAACLTVKDDQFRSDPVVLGVVAQLLDRYVLRVTCLVAPAAHWQVEYRLKAAAVDAVNEMRTSGADPLSTVELVAAVVNGRPR